MKVNVRTDIEVSPVWDVRPIARMLKGKHDNIYLIFSTLEDEPTECWEDQGDSFLLINLPKQKVLKNDVDYKKTIVEHLPLLEWLDLAQLQRYVEEKMQN